MTNVTVNWSTALVRERKLTVELDGRPPSGWTATAKRTARLLDPAQRGKLKIGKRKLRVSHVADGSEERLRHFLDSVVAEANAAHCAPGDPAGDEVASGRDTEMTRLFRSFATASADGRRTPR